MIFPAEIIENILLKCDGKTLLTAQNVHPVWKQSIGYLTQKTRIWEWCCREEIPPKELLDYLDKYNKNDRDRWLNIYSNWASWQNIDDNIQCDIILCPEVEMQKICCIAVSGDYIALGSETGRIKVLTECYKILYAARYQALRVTNINFICYDEESEYEGLCFVIAYPKTLVIDTCFHNEDKLVIEDVNAHSVHKNYICYEQTGGRITISRLVNVNGITQLEEVWFNRIYSPNQVSCLNIWNGVCTLLINKEVKTVHYNKANIIPVPVSGLEKKVDIRFTMGGPFQMPPYQVRHYYILRDDIIINSWQQTLKKDQFIEFFILHSNNDYSKKLFNTWEIFYSFITCIFVYGSTFMLGTDAGDVYLYHISTWKHFDVRNYKKKLIIGRHPIIGIDVKEYKDARTFYILTSFSLHKIAGFAICSN